MPPSTHQSVNRRIFTGLRKQAQAHDSAREKVIKASRDVIHLSKQIISAVHRRDIPAAQKKEKDIRKAVKTMRAQAKGPLASQGAMKAAHQEYVEALLYLRYVTDGDLATPQQLDVEFDSYLLGLCDLSGELVRRAVNQGLDGNYEEVYATHRFVTAIYNELLQFDFYGGELRKKFDSIKWDLKRMDEMVFALKVRGMRGK
ncbi:MAG: hypothetical protein ABIC95_03900 [archaeon]